MNSHIPRLRAFCHSHSLCEARFRAAQEARKHLERQVKMEEYQERRALAQCFFLPFFAVCIHGKSWTYFMWVII